MGGTTASAGRSRKVCMAPSGNGTLESGPQRKLFGTPVMQCLLQDYDGHSIVKHGDLLRLLYLLADNKTKRHFRDRHEAIDDESDAYCWRRSGFFWRMRASLGLACAQATTLAAQVFGQGNPRSRAGRTSP